MHFQKPPLGTPLDWENPLNKGTVLHLAMNEGHGDKVQDLSLYGNHGTLHNMAFPPTAVSGWNPGQTGVGLNFDGSDDYINIPDSRHLSSGYTFSAWIKPENFVGFNSILTSHAGAHFMLSANNLRLVDGGATNISYPLLSSTGTWINVVATYDGTNERLYENGNIMGAPVADAGGIDAYTSILCGKSDAHAGREFEGSIDQVRIQNRALTAKEVKDYTINPWQVYLDE